MKLQPAGTRTQLGKIVDWETISSQHDVSIKLESSDYALAYKALLQRTFNQLSVKTDWFTKFK
jgi:hypothetical protein